MTALQIVDYDSLGQTRGELIALSVRLPLVAASGVILVALRAPLVPSQLASGILFTRCKEPGQGAAKFPDQLPP